MSTPGPSPSPPPGSARATAMLSPPSAGGRRSRAPSMIAPSRAGGLLGGGFGDGEPSSPSVVPRGRAKSLFVAASGYAGVSGAGVDMAAKTLLSALQRIRAAASRAASPSGDGERDRDRGGGGGGERERSMSLVATSASAALSSSDVNKLRKQTYELTSGGVSGAISAKKLWRSGMLRLFSLRNAFDLKDKPSQQRGDNDDASSSLSSGHVSTADLGGAEGVTMSKLVRRALHAPSSSAREDGSGGHGKPLQSWDAMMSEFAGLNALHHSRFEGRSATVTLRESAEEESRWFHTGEVGSGLYSHLHLPLLKSKRGLINQLRFQIQPLNAAADDLELYVCCTHKLPTRNKHSWKLGRTQKLLIISKHDPKFAYGNGHFYISIYGIGKNVSMMTYALRIQASEDTFVPYQQLLLQAGVAAGPGGNTPLSELRMPRDTTAKNRLANKLHTLKHNRAAFDNFQRRVQDIIEVRMAAVQQQADQEQTALLEPAAFGKPRHVNYITTNRAHTEVSIHSPRDLKRRFWAGTLDKPRAGDGQLDGQPPREGEFVGSDDDEDARAGDTDAEDGGDHRDGGQGMGLSDDEELGVVAEHGDDEGDDAITSSPHFAQAAHHLSDLLNEAASAVEAHDSVALAVLLPSPQHHARRPSAIKIGSPSTTSSPYAHPQPRSAISAPGGAMSPLSGGLGGPPSSSASHSRRASRKASISAMSSGFQVPLTPVNLHLHDLLTARDEEMAAFALHDDGPRTRATSASHHHGHLHSSLQQAAAEKLRRLSKDYSRSEATLFAAASAAAAASLAREEQAQLAEQDASSVSFVPVPDDEPLGLASLLQPVPELASAQDPDTEAEVEVAEVEAGGSEAEGALTPRSRSPARSATNSTPSAEEVVGVISPDETASDVQPHDHPELGTLHMDLLHMDSVSQQDLASPRQDHISSSDSPSASASASVSGRRRPSHSRATSFFTEVSTAPSGSSADTHAALLRTVAQHAAEGGAITAVGSARKWIRMPFASPKTTKRRLGIFGSRAGAMDSASAPGSPPPEERAQTAVSAVGSQTARDSKQPERGSLWQSPSSRVRRLGPEELAVKSALLRQTVENNLKLTQVALNKKPEASNVGGGAHGEKMAKLSPAISSMVDTHGAMASNQYETTQAMHRSMALRRNNPTKWMGRNFAVRKSHAPDATLAGGRGPAANGVDSESPYLSSTSKTHRIKLELAYLHRTTRPKKEKHATKQAASITTAVADPAATTEDASAVPSTNAEPTAALPTSDLALLQLPLAIPSAVDPLSSTVVATAAPVPSALQSPSSSLARLRGSHFRTLSLPLHMILQSMPPAVAEEAGASGGGHAVTPTRSPSSPALPSEAIFALPSLNSRLVQLATGLMPVLEASDDQPVPSISAPPVATRATSIDSHGSTDQSPVAVDSIATAAVSSNFQLTHVADGAVAPALPPSVPTLTTSSNSPHASPLQRGRSLNRPGSAPNKVQERLVVQPSVLQPESLALSPRDLPSATPPSLTPVAATAARSLQRASSHAQVQNQAAATAVVPPVVVRNTVAPFLALADGSAPPRDAERDIVHVLQGDAYWASHFFRSAPGPGYAQATPLVLPVDRLSQLCLCLEFGSSRRITLAKSATSLEAGIIARLAAQHTLLLDKDASTLALPALPAEHPIRAHPFFLSHSLPMGSVVRWAPQDAKDHAQLTHARTQLRRLDTDLIALREAFERENEKLARIKAEDQAKAFERLAAKQLLEALPQPVPATGPLGLGGGSGGSSKKAHGPSLAEKRRRQERLGMGSGRGDAGVISTQLLLRVKPQSQLAQQLLLSPTASSASLKTARSIANLKQPVGSNHSITQPTVAIDPSTARRSSIPSSSHPTSSVPSPSFLPVSAGGISLAPLSLPSTSADELDIEATAAVHLAPRTLHEWHAKPSPEAKEDSTPAPSPMTTIPTPTHQHQPTRDDHLPFRPGSRASSAASGTSDRRSVLSFRLAHAAHTPSAADQLYGALTSPRRPSAPGILSPRTRRLISSISDATTAGDDESELDAPSSCRVPSGGSGGPQPLRLRRHHRHRTIDEFSALTREPPVTTTAAQPGSQSSRTAVESSPTASATVSAANLAQSFVRLTRALSNATLGTSASASAAQSTMQSSAASLHAPVSSIGSDASSGSSLARQTKLAQRKQAFGQVARSMRSEREAEQARQATHSHGRHAVHTDRGLSQSFASALTPVLNAVDYASEFAAGAITGGAGTGDLASSRSTFAGPYSGVTSTAYSAHHLSHQPHAAVLAAAKTRLAARHWQQQDESGGGVESLAIVHSGGSSLPASPAEFRAQRLIYAKINYQGK